MLFIAIWCGLSLTSVAATGSETEKNQHYLSIVKSAVKKFKDTKYENWQFTITQVENEEGDVSTSTQSHDPSREPNQKWQLVSLNGEAPSDRKRKKYSKKMHTEYGSYRPRNFFDNIVMDSLQLAHKTEEHLTFEFDVVTEEFGDDANDKLRGQFILNREQNFIESLTINNTESFSPQFLVTVSHLTLDLRYEQKDESILVKDIVMNLKGNLGPIEINEVNEVTFGDYKLATH